MRRDLSELLLSEVKDPRVSGFVSVTRVDTSVDYQFAKVYVSVYGTLREKQNTIDALQSASGFLRRQLRGRLRTRQVPAMKFMLDETLEEGNRMLDLLDSLSDQMGDPSESTAQQ